MKKLASTLPNMIISLGLITVIAGALLGAVYSATKEPIAKNGEGTAGGCNTSGSPSV